LNKNINIKLGKLTLQGIINVPEGAKSLIVFAHGSGSSRLSPRNNFVAEILQKNNFATLLFDLLTEKEDEIYENRFDIDLIAKRLIEATEWLLKNPETKNLAIGYFGASTGSAAAIKAAIVLKKEIKAVVSRGGRPDLAIDVISNLKAPILLIVGGNDQEVIELNQKACEKIECPKKTEIIPGATHLFEEPGALEKAADIAAEWFLKYLG
jgi:dienelactone hydrolase